jgi:hypothetical protein
MSVLQKIASLQNRRDEVPNQELAKELAVNEDREGIHEIAENLWNEDPNIAGDCIKVLYETGYLRPELITPYTQDFVKLLRSRNNRLVWGAMIALGTVARLQADELFGQIPEIRKAMEKGSVITVDNGIKVLAEVASAHETYRRALFPYLLDHLQHCRPKQVPQHAEKIAAAVDGENKGEFIAVLQSRMDLMNASQTARLKKLIREVEKR